MNVAFRILITIGLINSSFVSCERILVLFYHPGPSHFYSLYPLFNELAIRGHNVTVLTYTHVKDAHQNYNELLLTEMPVINGSITYDTMLPLDRSLFTMHAEMKELYNLAEIERELALKSPRIDQILAMHRNQPFDIVLVEQFISDVFLGLIYKLNVPFIGFSTCALPSYYYDQINLPHFPAFIPFAFSGFSWDMNFYDRTINWLIVKSTKLIYKFIQMRDNEEIHKRFGNDIPDVAEIGKRISLTFVNQHYSYAGPKAYSNQLIEIGGLHIKPSKPIPQHLKEVLDNAENGVLLVSWGGNVRSSSIPEHIQHEFVKGFAKLSMQVIWKWENASMQDMVSKNVYVTPWLPQQDILCHPNVRVFWSHGGNLGTIETVHCGKPAIVTPFYGDQYLNAAALNQRGMGFKIDLLKITADNIYNIVQKALDPKVVEAAQKVSYEHRNRLRSPLETAVWWVEHTIATSGFELGRANTTDMYWFTYHSIDVIIFILISFISIIVIFKFLLTQSLNILMYCCSRTKNVSNQTKKQN
ncbi:UDP-glucuronosyltransferase 2C1-like [Contarinia nasturtii]|uniref:UDP-glucuronosyltransferase 2C1-like n=1 Tax=Contarinia nasturtii TaxID=265458 RepID=UPI0012D40F70|nr:UDP-glucuronosyltransferase 2C1-like [Contarinia nasturtii]